MIMVFNDEKKMNGFSKVHNDHQIRRDELQIPTFNTKIL